MCMLFSILFTGKKKSKIKLKKRWIRGFQSSEMREKRG
jgi:hypothetical protein